MQTIYVTPEGERLFYKPALIEIEAAPLTIAERMAVITSNQPKNPVSLAPTPWGQS